MLRTSDRYCPVAKHFPWSEPFYLLQFDQEIDFFLNSPSLKECFELLLLEGEASAWAFKAIFLTVKQSWKFLAEEVDCQNSMYRNTEVL